MKNTNFRIGGIFPTFSFTFLQVLLSTYCFHLPINQSISLILLCVFQSSVEQLHMLYVCQVYKKHVEQSINRTISGGLER